MDRIVRPELLDGLPPDAPEALASRRDLRRINWLMGHLRVLRRALGGMRHTGSGPPLHIAELGAGDGDLASLLWTSLPRPPEGSHLWLLDQLPVVEPACIAALTGHGWQVRTVTAEVRAWLADPGHWTEGGAARLDLVYANLFLHHFDTESLRELLASTAVRSNAVVAVEPRRSVGALLGARLLGLVGCHPVTRHDAVVSVRAGFRGRELSSIWPKTAGWELVEGSRALFSHGFTARRAGRL